MKLKIQEVLLNENLINSQEIQEDEVHAIKTLHVLLDLVSNNPELVGTEQASDIVLGIEFAFQKLWNFPLSRNHHRYQWDISGCECPREDNLERFGSPYIIRNSNCKIHIPKEIKREIK